MKCLKVLKMRLRLERRTIRMRMFNFCNLERMLFKWNDDKIPRSELLIDTTSQLQQKEAVTYMLSVW
jgi:hypothetical protein